MIVIEVLAALVLLSMAVTVTGMAAVGLIGATGGTALKRCRSCGHLHTGWMTEGLCFYCHHGRLSQVMPLRLNHVFPAEMAPSQKG